MRGKAFVPLCVTVPSQSIPTGEDVRSHEAGQREARERGHRGQVNDTHSTAAARFFPQPNLLMHQLLRLRGGPNDFVAAAVVVAMEKTAQRRPRANQVTRYQSAIARWRD